MDCSEAGRKMEAFLRNELSIMDMRQYLRHIRECDACRSELELENIIRSAADETRTAECGYDFSHSLSDLIEERETRIRAYGFTTLLDLILSILIIGTIAAGIFL
ncbi:MAG: zf-HC2 domain-containing protein [Lachnospiraceae bacterium]|nr:zf-HC2 domain-containing protein [Lachnospiraceae bacterium]